jgi:iron complex outermembrane receptor protein
MDRDDGKVALPRIPADHRLTPASRAAFLAGFGRIAMSAQMAGGVLAAALAISPAAASTPTSGMLDAGMADADAHAGRTGLAGRREAPGQRFAQAVAPAGTVSSDANTLPAIEVSGERRAGELPPAYPGGQVARGGSLGLLGTKDVLDTPFSTVSFTSKLIEDQQARTAADTLINDASVRLTTGSNGFDDTFEIRGFPVNAGDVGLNGLYGLISSNRVQAQIIERIELLKGPSAFINGIAPGGSVGGSINIVTKRAGDEPLTRVTPAFISRGNFGVDIDTGRRFGPGNEWGVRFNGLIRDGEASIDRGDVQNSFGSLGLDYRGERVRWSFDAISQHDDTDNFRPQIGILPTANAIPRPPSARLNWFPGTTLQQKDNTLLTGVEFDATDWLTGFASVGHRDGANSQVFPFTISPLDPTGGFTVSNSFYDSYSRTTSGNIGVRARFDTGPVNHMLNVGFTGFRQETGSAFIPSDGVSESNIYRPSPLPAITAARTGPQRDSNSTLTSIAVSDTLSALNDRVLLAVGVRDQSVKVDGYDSVTQAVSSSYDASKTSPLAGLVVKPLENVSVYASYAEGLTKGDVVGVGYSNVGAVLAPYVSTQIETGVKVDWGSVTTTAAVFELSRPNSIRTAANALAYDGEQSNRGLELSAFGEIQPGLRGILSAAFINPELSKTEDPATRGNKAAGVPDATFSASLEWDTPWIPKLSLNSRVIYTSGSYLTDANRLRFNDWVRVDVGARYAITVADKPVILRANIENLFDERYWLTTGTYVTVGAPRTFVASASIFF